MLRTIGRFEFYHFARFLRLPRPCRLVETRGLFCAADEFLVREAFPHDPRHYVAATCQRPSRGPGWADPLCHALERRRRWLCLPARAVPESFVFLSGVHVEGFHEQSRNIHKSVSYLYADYRALSHMTGPPDTTERTYQEEFRKLNSGVTASDVVTLR